MLFLLFRDGAAGEDRGRKEEEELREAREREEERRRRHEEMAERSRQREAALERVRLDLRAHLERVGERCQRLHDAYRSEFERNKEN
jgi:hypothetical protein